MAICPHCRENTIGVHAKYWASAAHPAKCGRCGGLSYIANTHGTAAGRAIWLVPFIAVIAAIGTASFWPLAVGVAAMLGLKIYDEIAFYRQPMLPTSHAEAAESLGWERVGSGILAFVALVTVVAYGISRAV